jgi:hypothetical protein
LPEAADPVDRRDRDTVAPQRQHREHWLAIELGLSQQLPGGRRLADDAEVTVRLVAVLAPGELQRRRRPRPQRPAQGDDLIRLIRQPTAPCRQTRHAGGQPAGGHANLERDGRLGSADLD